MKKPNSIWGFKVLLLLTQIKNPPGNEKNLTVSFAGDHLTMILL